MMSIQQSEVIGYVEMHIGDFHTRRLESLKKLKLTDILKRKNPYLFRAKNILTGEVLVKTLLESYLSSQEEAMFGEFLEGLAIYICSRVYGGKKSAADGMDLEFKKDEIFYIVSIKSGPNWGNSRQIKKLEDDFRRAKRILRTSGQDVQVIAVNGCCYGVDRQPDKGDYFKYCGQDFWEFISGDNNLFVDIIEPIGFRAKERNQDFHQAYAQIVNLFTKEFAENFYTGQGAIDWEKLVRFNSGRNV